MFFWKKDKKELQDEIIHIKRRLRSMDETIDENKNDLVSCAKCKCVLKIGDAFRSKGVVKIEEYCNLEYIYHDYFCKIHIPKKKKAK